MNNHRIETATGELLVGRNVTNFISGLKRLVLYIYLGGFGCKVGLIQRAKLLASGHNLRDAPAIWMDFESDRPVAQSLTRYGIDEGLAVLAGPDEKNGIYFNLSVGELNELIQQIRLNDPRVKHLAAFIPSHDLDILTRASEAGQTPAIARFHLAANETLYGRRSFYSVLSGALSRLTPNGEAVNDLLSRGYTGVIHSDRIVVNIVTGASGGTGPGLCIAAAIAARQIAAQNGHKVDIRVSATCGEYHHANSDRELKKKRALAACLSNDLSIASNDSSARWKFPATAAQTWSHNGVLIDRVLWFEANERWANGDKSGPDACAAGVARGLNFLNHTDAGYREERTWANEIAGDYIG